MQTSRPDSRLSLGNNKLPLCALFFRVLHNRNFRLMLDFNGRFRFKRGKETQNFALRSILKEHLYRFLQVFLRLNDGFPLARNSQFVTVGNIPIIFPARLRILISISSLSSS